jgi:iron complex outermembrane recepter protein
VKTSVRVKLTSAVLIALSAVATPVSAQSTKPDLADLDLETLMQVRVRSVAREEQDVLRTPAAVFVITQDDIRQSGVTDVAELLRMVPGLNVAQINSSTWAVGSRGFGAQYSTKLLVLVDGRSVYDPGFSGVFWHLLNLRLADIERIEVIRGPGATMWGANAVNGVISITTKSAADTPGGSAQVSAGSYRPGDAAMHFGGDLGASASYRVFGRQTSRSALPTEAGENGGDSWNATDAGFRIDWDAPGRDSFVVTGGAHRSVAGDRRQIVTSLAPVTFAEAGLSGIVGNHIAGTWTRKLAPRSDVQLQLYYDHRLHTRYGGKAVDIFDADLQHSFNLGQRNHLTWGLGYRAARDTFDDSLAFGLTPASATTRLGSAFVQNETALVTDTLFLTVGSKFEHSTFSGANVQPAVRALWRMTNRQSLWGSVGRAVRTPNRVERGMHLSVGAIPLGPSDWAIMELLGQESTTSEELLAREAGYRYQVNRRLWFDAAVFRNTYDQLSIVEPGQMFFRPAPTPGLVLPLYFTNAGAGITNGAELAAHYQVHSHVTLKGSYSLLDMDLNGPNGDDVAVTGSSLSGDRRDARHQAHLASTFELPKALEVSSHLYFTGGRPSLQLPSYTRFDVVGSWRATDKLDLRVVGQNLFGSHIEFAGESSPSNPIRRSAHVEVGVSF